MDADLVRSSFTRWLHLPPPPFQQQHADAQLGFCLQAEWRDHVGPLTRAMLDGLAFGPAAGVARRSPARASRELARRRSPARSLAALCAWYIVVATAVI